MKHKILDALTTKRLNRRQFTAGATIAGAAIATTGVAATRAQSRVGTPIAASPSASGFSVATVASGLNSPRFIAIEGDTVYFTEAGTGGKETFFATPGAGTPTPTDPAGMRGPSGKLSSIAADGTVTAIVSDFTSYTFGANGEIIGASGVALDGNGNAFIAVGAPGPNLPVIKRTGTEGVVYQVSLADGSKKILADLAQYEIDNNPDPYAIDSDLYGAAFLDGVVYVADAGGNDVLAVKVADGTISTFAVTDGLDAPFLPPSGNPLRGGTGTIDSVPSAVVTGPDGKIYVGFVTGGPFPAGLAPVYDYAPDGTKAVFVTGLTMIGGLAFSSDGTLYVSVMSTDYVNQKPGQVVRVGTDGTLTVVIDNLLVPAGIAFDSADNLFIAHKSTGFLGAGEILKYTGVTTVTGTPFVVTVPAAAASPAATPVAAANAAVSMNLEDVKFSKTAVTIPANTNVTFTFNNTGALPHDFTIDDPKITSGTVAPGATVTLKANVPAGTYQYYCSQPGHKQAGMVGTLTAK